MPRPPSRIFVERRLDKMAAFWLSRKVRNGKFMAKITCGYFGRVEKIRRLCILGITKIRLGGGLGSSDSNLHAALPLQK